MKRATSSFQTHPIIPHRNRPQQKTLPPSMKLLARDYIHVSYIFTLKLALLFLTLLLTNCLNIPCSGV